MCGAKTANSGVTGPCSSLGQNRASEARAGWQAEEHQQQQQQQQRRAAQRRQQRAAAKQQRRSRQAEPQLLLGPQHPQTEVLDARRLPWARSGPVRPSQLRWQTQEKMRGGQSRREDTQQQRQRQRGSNSRAGRGGRSSNSSSSSGGGRQQQRRQHQQQNNSRAAVDGGWQWQGAQEASEKIAVRSK